MASGSKDTKGRRNVAVGLRAKYQGCMVGALIGDCLGSPFEKLPRRPPLEAALLPKFLHRILTRTVKPDKDAGHRFRVDTAHPLGGHYMYTDDTAMAHALAASLLDRGGFDPQNVAVRFTEEFYDNKDVKGEYGPKVRNVFAALRKTHYGDVWAPARNQFEGTGSFGNGASMRVAPVALYYASDEATAIKVAQDQAKLTHAHMWGYNGAVVICLAIQLALSLDPRKGLDVERFLNCLMHKMEGIEDDGFYYGKLKKIRKMMVDDNHDYTPAEVADLLGNEITADRSVPSAVYCFLRGAQSLKSYPTSNGFVRSLFFAISLGGDTDTIGTMTAAIAGAYYGIFRIPRNMQKYCQSERLATNLACRLLEASQALQGRRFK